MDGVTLTNLDVLSNSSLATTEGTLLQCLQHCYTAFGLFDLLLPILIGLMLIKLHVAASMFCGANC